MADTRKNPDALTTTILLGAILLGLIWILSGGGLQELFTDAKSYEKDWAKVGRLESSGQYQSADQVVTRIERRAREKKNAFQEAKAIMAHMRLQPQFLEDWESHTERAWKEAIPRWEFPYGQFGHSILGQFYWDYAQSNQWRLAGRSNVPSDTADFREWGIQRLAMEAEKHFQASLKAPDSLGKVGLKAFESMMLSRPCRRIRQRRSDHAVHVCAGIHLPHRRRESEH